MTPRERLVQGKNEIQLNRRRGSTASARSDSKYEGKGEKGGNAVKGSGYRDATVGTVPRGYAVNNIPAIDELRFNDVLKRASKQWNIGA